MLVFSMFLVPLVVIVLLGIVFMSGAAGSISDNPDSLDDSTTNTDTNEISGQDPEGFLNSPILM
jgi:hypothetical protein